MAEEKCKYCKDCEEGLLPETRPAIETIAVIETLMSCGCGGTVRHAVLRCKHCKKYYLSSYYEHKSFDTNEEFEIKQISKTDTEKLISLIKKCGNPEDADCRCDIHRKLEFAGKQVKGKLKYSESIPK